MKYPIFCISDRKGSFFHPRLEISDASAKRYFAMLVNNNDPQNMIHFCPFDYQLFEVGIFDDSNGKMEVLDEIKFICSGDELVGVYNEK